MTLTVRATILQTPEPGQLEVLEERNEARRRNAAKLNQRLDGIDGLMLPCTFEGRTHVWHQYTVRVLDNAPITRDELSEHLASHNIGNGMYYPKVAWDYDCYRDHELVVADDAPNAFDIARQVLSLPIHHGLTVGDIDRIVIAVRSAFV